MAVLDVTYHQYAHQMPPRGKMVGNSQQLDFTSAQQLGAIQSEGVVARVVTDADCRILVSSAESPTLTAANSMLLTAGMVFDDIVLSPGERVVVAAV